MNLTKREIDVLRLVGAGLNAETAGKKLRLSRRTVEAHLLNAKAKLGAENTTHAVVLALKQKIFALKDL